MGESAKRFPTREAIQNQEGGKDELRNPCKRSLTTRRVSLVTRMIGVDCDAYPVCEPVGARISTALVTEPELEQWLVRRTRGPEGTPG